MTCIICKKNLIEYKLFNEIPRVTSDCKPFERGGQIFICQNCGLVQKKKSLKWLNEIESIYNNYQIYDLANGNEQVIFTSNGPVRRSEKLVEYLLVVV